MLELPEDHEARMVSGLLYSESNSIGGSEVGPE